MAATTVNMLVARLADAGLRLALAPQGGLAVAPSSRLTADLRQQIRSAKEMLVSWLEAANDAASHTSDPTGNPADWMALATAYYAHHFTCPTCTAAGRGAHYGRRCAVGTALWRPYSTDTPDSSATDGASPSPNGRYETDSP